MTALAAFKFAFLALSVWQLINAKPSAYDNTSAQSGNQVWGVSNPSKEVRDSIQEFYQDGLVDVFQISTGYARFKVEPSNFAQVRSELEGKGAVIVVEVQDVKQFLDDIEKKSPSRSAAAFDGKSLPTNSYMTFSEIETYLTNLADSCEGITKESIGTTTEGRDIWMITLKAVGSTPTKSVFIEGGIHAREWISPAVTLYFIEQLSNNMDLIDGMEVRVVPMANPDGYSYSHTNDRLWRKNRRDNSASSCMGVDLNRNWDYQYGVTGTSTNPCSEVYRGTSAFSELETTAVSQAMLSTPNVALALAIHSYGQYILYPWGYTTDSFEGQNDLKNLGEAFSDAVFSVHGKRYTAMSGADMYPASGATDDWAYAVLQAPYAFTIELRDQGQYGFELPANQITETREEAWAGFLVLLDKAKQTSCT